MYIRTYQYLPAELSWNRTPSRGEGKKNLEPIHRLLGLVSVEFRPT